MKLSESWLREWVSPSLSLEEIAAQLTQAGLEVENISGSNSYPKMVVGEVMRAAAHPNADRLKLCQVSDGSGICSIVCGATNARPGIKVALALPGSFLPSGLKIKRAKIRGEVSEGMLCSGDELALEGEWEGILELDKNAKTGAPLEQYLHKDRILDIAITPNRGDCLSLRGVARELAALNNLPFTQPRIKPVQARHKSILKVELLQPQGCSRYFGRIIKDLDVSRPSPVWLQKRLEAAGLRSIDATVDITNYVMLELGQPLHAFDLARIQGGIRVRLAEKKEKLTLLDGQVLELDESDLLITDHKKPLALAGVMGGKDSGISKETKDVFLEGAFFSPDIVRGKQRKFNFTTEAAHRFERGVDYELPRAAMERATHYFVDILGGSAGPLNETVVKKQLPVRKPLIVSQRKLDEFLGFSIPLAESKRILRTLGMKRIQETKDGFKLLPPSFRFDMDCWEAVAEEVSRIYGYDAVPISLPSMPLKPRLAALTREDEIRHQLAARGYQEIISYSFISNRDYKLTSPATAPLRLANPISKDMISMRPSLLAGLLNSLSHNYRQSVARQKLFEVGMCFVPHKKDYLQETRIAGAVLAAGQFYNQEGYDFYSLKGDVEILLSSLGTMKSLRMDFSASSPFLHPVQSLSWQLNKEEICHCGLVHPSINEAFKLKREKVYFFELRLDRLASKPVVVYEHFSRYPPAQRELSLVMRETTSYQEIKDFIFSYGGRQLQRMDLLDVYRSPELGEQKKSLSLRLVWQSPDETLTDTRINELLDRLLKRLADEKNILLREG